MHAHKGGHVQSHIMAVKPLNRFRRNLVLYIFSERWRSLSSSFNQVQSTLN